jgi:hypothetical protein
MHSLPGLQLANVSPSGFVYHEPTQFIRRNEFHRICGKSGSDGQEKSEEEINFHWMQGVSAWPKNNRLWQDAQCSDNPNLYYEA